MILLDVVKSEPFTTLYYEMTWKISWDQIMSFTEVLLRDFAKRGIQSLEVGYTGCAPDDVTKELMEKHLKIQECSFAGEEKSMVVVAGDSEVNEIPMRFTFWANTNRCMVNLKNDDQIEKKGDHAYDKYMDSLEIMGHVEFTKRVAKN